MPSSDSTVNTPTTASITTEEVDLDLQLPTGFDLQPLVPGDRLLRLHPNWFIDDFKQDGDFFSATIRDYVTDDEFPLSGTFTFNADANELLAINLTKSLDARVVFQNADNKLRVQVTSEEREIDAADPLLLWIRAIKEYIRIYTKTTPVTLFFRLLMNRMMLQMNPSQRKICMLLAKITFVEILVIIFILVGYVIFVLR